MAAFLETLRAILNAMGASVMLPIVVFLFALILRAKPGQAFRAGVTIGVAFVGINLVIGVMWTSLSEVSQLIVTKTGVQLDAVDVGWPVAASIAFGSSVGTFIIPVAIAVNLLMLVTRTTRTLNIDIWNFWHFAFVGTMLVVVTGNLWIGMLGSVAATMIALLLADFTAKAVQKQFGLPGVSITTASAHSFLLPAIPINRLLDRIPGVKDWNLDPEAIKRRFGVLGEPVILGLVLGAILGVIAFLPPGEGGTITDALIKILRTAIDLAAVLLLMPRMVAILMEGLMTISEAAREFMAQRFQGREIHLGLDAAVLIGHPSTLATSLLLIPITILLAIILPGNRMMPFADFAALPFFVALLVPITRGNVVRMLILGTLGAVAGLYMATWMAPIQTEAAMLVAAEAVPEGAGLITNMGDGWVTSAWALLAPARAGGSVTAVVSLVAGIGIVLGLCVAFNRNPAKWERWSGADRNASESDASAP